MKRWVRFLTGMALLVMSTLSLGAASAQESGTITFSATRSCDDAITWIVTSPVTAQMYIGFSNTSDNWSAGPSPFSTNYEYNEQTYGREFDKVAFFNPGAEGFVLLATLDVGACGVTASTTLAVADVEPSDTDGDGISDDVDECPEVAGPAENGGCPAGQSAYFICVVSNGVQYNFETFGEAVESGYFSGVDPETGKLVTGYGVTEVNCPSVPSPELDTDGDGVPDNVDRCPSSHGGGSDDGCPREAVPDGWQDITFTPVDLVIEFCRDGQDESATVWQILNGEVEGVYVIAYAHANAYIPWPEFAGITPGKCLNPVPVDTDGDAINDDVDECPEVAGPADNNGCPVPNIPGVWSIETVSLVCTATGVDVTYTIAGEENVPADGGLADVQIRPAEGGTPLVSEFSEVTQGNPGPYTVSIESEDLTSGVFQAWVFKVGTNDHVYSQAINCDEAPVTPGEPGEGETPAEGETPDAGETPAIPTDGNTGSGSSGNDAMTRSTSGTGTVTSLPSTGTGITTQNDQLLALLAVTSMAILGSAWKLRSIQ